MPNRWLLLVTNLEFWPQRPWGVLHLRRNFGSDWFCSAEWFNEGARGF